MEKNPDASDEIAGNYIPFLYDVEQLGHIIELVQSKPVPNKLELLLKIVIYWINYKYEALLENEMVDSIRQLFFEFFIQNISTYSSDLYNLVATAQAGIYINIFDQWEEFMPWIFEQSTKITSLFFIKLSEISRKLFVIKNEQITAIREMIKSSEYMQSLYEFINSLVDSKNPHGFLLLSYISEWCDLDLLISDEIVQKYYDGLSTKEFIKPIFQIFQNIVIRIEGEEQKVQMIGSLISQDAILEYTQQCEDDTFGECASKYLYMCFISIDDTDAQEALVEIGRNLVPICGSAKTHVLKILNSLVLQNNELIQDVFEYAWEICLMLSSSELLKTENFDDFKNEIEEPLNSIALCKKINKEATEELLNAVFESTDVESDPQTALAQTMLLFHPQIFTDGPEQLAQQLAALAEIGADEILGSQPHLNLFLGAAILAPRKKKMFEPYAETIHQTLFDIVTNEDHDESIISAFVQPYTAFVSNFSSLNLDTETMGALLMTLNPVLVATAAVGLSRLGDSTPILDALQLLKELLDSDDPKTAAVALCAFIENVKIEEPIAHFLQSVESIAEEDDEVMSHYIKALPSLSLSDHIKTATNLGALLESINGPKSAIAMCQMVRFFRTPKKWVPDDDDAGFVFINSAVAALFEHVQRASAAALAGIESDVGFEKLVVYFEAALGRAARLKRMPCLDQMPEFAEWVAVSLRAFAGEDIPTNSLIRFAKLILEVHGELFDTIAPEVTDFLLIPGGDPNAKEMKINERLLVSTLRFFHSLFADALPAMVEAFGERIGIDEETSTGLYMVDPEQAENAPIVQKLFLTIWRARNS